MSLLPTSRQDVRAVGFARDLSRFGARPALVTADREISYAELAGLVNQARERLGAGRRLVLLAAGNDVASVVVYLAALAGGHAVLLGPAGDESALGALARVYDPDVVVRAAGERWDLEERRPGTAHELHPELALLLSTSGSTGSPKLVRLSQENLEANAAAIGGYLRIRDTDRAATTLPLYYCYGLSVLNSHLHRGAALVLTGLSVVDPCFWELFRRAGATSLAAVPYTFDLLERVGFAGMDLPHLRYVTQAGGRLAPSRVARYAELGRRRGWDLVVMYGQTEATARMAYLPPDLALTRPEAIGRPIPGGHFTLEPAPGWNDPDVGELVYAGPNVMLGYAESPEDLRLGRTVGVLRTGDLARRGDDGLYEVVGRRSRFVKIVGLRVDLQRVEALLAEDGVPGCCAGDDQQVVVAVEGAPADLDEVRRALVARLGLPSRAVRVVAVERVPRLATGKPDYPAVLRLAGAPPPARTAAGPTDEPADGPAPHPQAGVGRLAALYAELLERDDVTEASSFVSLGGDSLSYVEVSVRLEEALGQLPAGWHTLPIRDLAARARPARRRTTLETSVALRAVAIVLIVGSHSWLFSVLGGAHVLLAVAGFNVARFQLAGADTRRRARALLAAASRIALPTAAWVVVASLLTDRYTPANAVLLNAVVGPDRWGPEWHFWFVEALVYTLLGLAAVLAVPAVTRVERRFPFGTALAFLALGLLPRYGLLDVGPGPVTQAPATVFWFFALGWAAARATTAWRRALVAVLALATVPGFFDDPQRAVVVLAGLGLLLWVPAVPSTGLLNRVAAVLAGGSLYVYLTHWVVIPHLDHVAPPLAVLASLALGLAYWWFVGRAAAALRSARWLAGVRR